MLPQENVFTHFLFRVAFRDDIMAIHGLQKIRRMLVCTLKFFIPKMKFLFPTRSILSQFVEKTNVLLHCCFSQTRSPDGTVH